MKKVVLVMGFIVFGFCTYVIAQDKVVVIPLNSGAKVGGADKQLQYNNNGTLSGAEVYYDDVNGGVGVGTATPEAGHKLHVNGLAKFDLNAGSLYISTPGGNPGLIVFEGFNGHRRDITFGDLGMALTASDTSSPPPITNGILISENGDVGIGTNNPASTLQVNGYIQLAVTSTAPPAADCDEVAERGRMIVNNVSGNGILYVCVDVGWRSTTLGL